MIDTQAALSEPGEPQRLRTAFDSGNHTHLNDAGYRALADLFDLHLFEGPR